MKLFEITYIIGKIERTCICVAENRVDAQTKVANTEPDDCTVHIISTMVMDESTVYQMNERPSQLIGK